MICCDEHAKHLRDASCPWCERDEAVRLLESARLIIEKLRVFGNDNVHKYDVPPFLAAIDAYLAKARR